MPSFDIAVIGAGITGLNAANILHKAGHRVQVFEKSRGLGGRLATRRTDVGIFNHGAQFATARHPDFIRYLEQGVKAGIAQHWRPEKWQDGSDNETSALVPTGSLARDENPGRAETWYRGHPAMNNLVSALNTGFTIHRNVRIARIAPVSRNRFELLSHPVTLQQANPLSHGVFDGVIVAIPAPQSAEILMPLSPRFDVLDDVEIAPCWAVMLAFAPSNPIPYDVFASPDPAIAWIGRNPDGNTAAGNGEYTRWTIHASVEWSREHLEDKASNVAETIHDLAHHVFKEAGITLPQPVLKQAHRWRYARTTHPLGQSHIASADGRIIAAGDWCMGARIEAAYQSGESAAHAIMTSLQTPWLG
ncbi:NAD(P)/FAD-dependent oxidoreductase [Thalassospira marina]|uniref:FAD-dependent oxidoreductase n=1 Tax=Thalassospira marina TaxID=2048283 RepID=A0ABM6Q972_9PROT|nr:FAD-dependent oxidoreductase [Thalassospira marina]AUG53093.1 FAD-dependent oxidoreductase [Thalassospira marina]